MPQSTKTLYQHVPHPHTPKNINATHAAQQAQGNAVQRFNAALAVHATVVTSSVWCFYFFLIISGTGFPGIPWLSATPQAFVAWFSSQFLQLILLPLIAAGTALVGRKQELLAQEQYQFSVKTYHDTEQMLRHLDAQDTELLRQSAMIARLLGSNIAPDAPPPNEKPPKVTPPVAPLPFAPDPKPKSTARKRPSRAKPKEETS